MMEGCVTRLKNRSDHLAHPPVPGWGDGARTGAGVDLRPPHLYDIESYRSKTSAVTIRSSDAGVCWT